MIRILSIFTVLVLIAPSALGQAWSYGKKPMNGELGPKEPDGVRFNDAEKIGKKVPLDLTFYDHDAKPVTLREVIGGKPTILCLGYYRCPKLCNEVQGGMLQALNDMRAADPKFVAGGPFNVVTVSIDPREAPLTLARAKRIEYLKNYDNRSPETPGWWFLTANHGQGTESSEADGDIHELAEAVGFEYTLRANGANYGFDRGANVWKQQGNGSLLPVLPRNYDYNHSSGLVLLTPDGTISSYIFGIVYSGSQLRTSIVMASQGKAGTFFERNVSPYCQVYDNVKGHYKTTYRALGIVFTPVMLFVMYLAYVTVRRGMRETPINLPTQQTAPGGV